MVGVLVALFLFFGFLLLDFGFVLEYGWEVIYIFGGFVFIYIYVSVIQHI